MANFSILNLFKDGKAACLIRVAEFMLPLMLLGSLGNQVLLYISGAIAAVALVLFVARLVAVRKSGTACENAGGWAAMVGSLLDFPYIVLLCSLIAMQAGIDAEFGLWFALGLAVLVIVSHLGGKK